MQVRALVVGYGSIGERHARLLGELGVDTAVCSRREVSFEPSYTALDAAVRSHRPDYVVVANETSAHFPTLAKLAEIGFTGNVLVEKPLFDRCFEHQEYPFRRLSIAYNLRFHPALLWLKAFLARETLLTVNAYVGQYLPAWRPGRDYRLSYSARRSAGGGVLRDLSHELDYLAWLCGKPNSVTALGGRFSSLEIDSDDVFALLIRAERCPAVSLQLSYLDRVARRRILINTQDHAVEVDLIHNRALVDGKETVFDYERDLTYRNMYRALLAGDWQSVSSFEDGLASMRLIDAAERANESRTWVDL